jgi:hypothetical protein
MGGNRGAELGGAYRMVAELPAQYGRRGTYFALEAHGLLHGCLAC